MNSIIKILITGGNGNIANIIKNNFLNNNNYIVTSLGRNELNLLNYNDVNIFFENPSNNFDVLIHTAIIGGRRTTIENEKVTHDNLLMMENILKFQSIFKMIINLDSGAIYDRSTDILNRKENELYTIPNDFYGFSKYVIYQRSLLYNHMYNFRIFNIFHDREESDRFIKICFNAKYSDNKEYIHIYDDKYFDFFYKDDFTKLLEFYLLNIDNQNILHKTINLSYDEKYKLSDIAKLIVDESQINIKNTNSINNYSGDGSLIKSFNLNLDGIRLSLKKYEQKNIQFYINKIVELKNSNASTNIHLDINLISWLNVVAKKERSVQTIYKLLSKYDSLDTIFNENNIDYKNIKFIIFTIPKTGTHTFIKSLSAYKILSFHSIIELLYIDIRFYNYTIYDIINFIEYNTNHEQIYIFSSYRNPYDRYISCYYHKQKVDKLDNLPTFVDKTDFSNTDILNNFNYFFNEQLIIFNINLLQYKYDKENGTCIVPYLNKCKWIFTFINDIAKCITNLHKIDRNIGQLVMKMNNINSSRLYNDNKHKVKFEDNFRQQIYEEEKEYISFFS